MRFLPQYGHAVLIRFISSTFLTLYSGTGFRLEIEETSERETMGLKIGEVAERSGVNLQTIRYYEREKLLPEPPRLASGYRVYPDQTVRRIRFIKRAQEIGFTLAEIRELLAIRISADRDSSDVRTIAQAKITDIDEKIQTLQRMKKALGRITQRCSGCVSASECPILESIDSEEMLQ
jgi:MerR family mercuric resistance operon transcriptional regulator